MAYTSVPGGSAGTAPSSLPSAPWSCRAISTEAAMRRRNCIIAGITPILTATTRSAKTVSTKVISRIATSARGARTTMAAKCRTSLML